MIKTPDPGVFSFEHAPKSPEGDLISAPFRLVPTEASGGLGATYKGLGSTYMGLGATKRRTYTETTENHRDHGEPQRGTEVILKS